MPNIRAREPVGRCALRPGRLRLRRRTQGVSPPRGLSVCARTATLRPSHRSPPPTAIRLVVRLHESVAVTMCEWWILPGGGLSRGPSTWHQALGSVPAPGPVRCPSLSPSRTPVCGRAAVCPDVHRGRTPCWFLTLARTNAVAANTCARASVRPEFSGSGETPWSAVARFCDRCVFSVLRNCQSSSPLGGSCGVWVPRALPGTRTAGTHARIAACFRRVPAHRCVRGAAGLPRRLRLSRAPG